MAKERIHSKHTFRKGDKEVNGKIMAPQKFLFTINVFIRRIVSNHGD